MVHTLASFKPYQVHDDGYGLYRWRPIEEG
jgi:hypothetical protein